MYVNEVIERMVHHMEEKYLMDKMLPLEDVSSKIK